jgi:hypothetical protein
MLVRESRTNSANDGFSGHERRSVAIALELQSHRFRSEVNPTSQEENMKLPSKLRTTALAAALMTASVPSLTTSAEAHGGWGWGWGGFGIGLAAGALIGGALAAPHYGYYGYYAPAYYPGYYGYGYGYPAYYGYGYGYPHYYHRHWHHHYYGY